MGSRRPALWPLDHLVPARGRSLHRLYGHRDSRRRVRHWRFRVLRSALHDHRLSVPVPDVTAAVGGLAKARLHYGRGFCARPLRPQRAGGCGRGHRHPGDNAVHRPATRRAREGHSGARLLRPGNHGARADHHRLRDSRALHLQERAARAGDDRICQGRDDLHFRHRGHRDHSLRARGLRSDLRSGE